MAAFEHPAMHLESHYYTAIGEFMFRYAQLEYQLHEIIWFALGLDYKQGRILTIGTENKVLRTMIGTITSTNRWVSDKKLIQEMNSLAGIAKTLGKPRNILAHGSWQSADASAKNANLHYMKERENRLLPIKSEINYEMIYGYVSQLKNANDRAQRLIVKLGGVPPPSLGKLSPQAKMGRL